jgi:Mg2+ and Co2+ transporter CorA
MIRVVERCYKMYTQDNLDNLDTRGDLMTRIDQLWSAFQVLRHEAEFYTRRTEANRQTVYSLIAQKDNRTNFKIAEATRSESMALKVMAEATAQDSTSMVVVSTVTLFFLPATFLSSLFSTTFFNFQYPEPSTMSGSQWIYWAITLPLTIMLWLVHWLWTKKKARDVNQRLGGPTSRDIEEKSA